MSDQEKNDKECMICKPSKTKFSKLYEIFYSLRQAQTLILLITLHGVF